jgi:hypothetical protein
MPRHSNGPKWLKIRVHNHQTNDFIDFPIDERGNLIDRPPKRPPRSNLYRAALGPGIVKSGLRIEKKAPPISRDRVAHVPETIKVDQAPIDSDPPVECPAWFESVEICDWALAEL